MARQTARRPLPKEPTRLASVPSSPNSSHESATSVKASPSTGAAMVTTVYLPTPTARPPTPSHSATVFRRALVGNAVIVVIVLLLAPVFILHEVRAMAPENPPTPTPKWRELEAAFLRTGEATHNPHSKSAELPVSCEYQTLDLDESPLGERVVCGPDAVSSEPNNPIEEANRPIYDPTPTPPISPVAAHVRDVLEGRLPPVIELSCHSLELPMNPEVFGEYHLMSPTTDDTIAYYQQMLPPPSPESLSAEAVAHHLREAAAQLGFDPDASPEQIKAARAKAGQANLRAAALTARVHYLYRSTRSGAWALTTSLEKAAKHKGFVQSIDAANSPVGLTFKVFRHGESQWQAAPEIVVSAVGQQPRAKDTRASITAVFADLEPGSSSHSSSSHTSVSENTASTVTEVAALGETREDFLPGSSPRDKDKGLPLKSAPDTITSAGTTTEPSVLSEREMAAIEDEEAAARAEEEAKNEAALLDQERRMQEMQAAAAKEKNNQDVADALAAEHKERDEAAAAAEAAAEAEQAQALELLAREKEELHAARVAKAAALYSTKNTNSAMTNKTTATSTATADAPADSPLHQTSSAATATSTTQPRLTKPAVAPSPAPVSLLSLLGRIRLRGSLVALWYKWWSVDFSLAGAIAIAGALALVLFAVVIAALVLEALFKFLAVKVPEAANAMSPASKAVARAAGRVSPRKSSSSRATTYEQQQQPRDSEDQSAMALAAHQRLELANLRRTVATLQREAEALKSMKRSPSGQLSAQNRASETSLSNHRNTTPPPSAIGVNHADRLSSERQTEIPRSNTTWAARTNPSKEDVDGSSRLGNDTLRKSSPSIRSNTPSATTGAAAAAASATTSSRATTDTRHLTPSAQECFPRTAAAMRASELSLRQSETALANSRAAFQRTSHRTTEASRGRAASVSAASRTVMGSTQPAPPRAHSMGGDIGGNDTTTTGGEGAGSYQYSRSSSSMLLRSCEVRGSDEWRVGSANADASVRRLEEMVARLQVENREAHTVMQRQAAEMADLRVSLTQILSPKPTNASGRSKAFSSATQPARTAPRRPSDTSGKGNGAGVNSSNDTCSASSDWPPEAWSPPTSMMNPHGTDSNPSSNKDTQANGFTFGGGGDKSSGPTPTGEGHDSSARSPAMSPPASAQALDALSLIAKAMSHSQVPRGGQEDHSNHNSTVEESGPQGRATKKQPTGPPPQQPSDRPPISGNSPPGTIPPAAFDISSSTTGKPTNAPTTGSKSHPSSSSSSSSQREAKAAAAARAAAKAGAEAAAAAAHNQPSSSFYPIHPDDSARPAKHEGQRRKLAANETQSSSSYDNNNRRAPGNLTNDLAGEATPLEEVRAGLPRSWNEANEEQSSPGNATAATYFADMDVGASMDVHHDSSDQSHAATENEATGEAARLNEAVKHYQRRAPSSMTHSELRRLIKECGVGNETRIEEELADFWAREHRRKEGEHEEVDEDEDEDEDAADLSYVNELSEEEEVEDEEGAKAHAVSRRARATCDDVVEGSNYNDHQQEQENDDDDDGSASVFAAYMAAATPPSPATRSSSSSKHSQRQHTPPRTSSQPRLAATVDSKSPSVTNKSRAAPRPESRGHESGVASDSLGPSVRFSSDASYMRRQGSDELSSRGRRDIRRAEHLAQVAAYLEAESTTGDRSPSESSELEDEESFDAETLEAVALALSARYEPSERTLEFGDGPIGISFTSFVDIAVDSRVIADRVGKEGGMPVGASILVTAVDPRGPASQAGLLPGDLIVAVDGRAVPSTMSKDDFFYALLDAKRPVELTFRVRLRNAQGE